MNSHRVLRYLDRLGITGSFTLTLPPTTPFFLVFFPMETARPHELRAACSARASAAWPYLFRKTCLIYGMELLASVLFFEGRYDARASCWIYIDYNNFLSAHVGGDSYTGAISV